MAFFDQEFASFFEGLARNNHKEWFLRRDLAAHLMRHRSAARPLNEYLGAALGGLDG